MGPGKKLIIDRFDYLGGVCVHAKGTLTTLLLSNKDYGYIELGSCSGQSGSRQGTPLTASREKRGSFREVNLSQGADES